MDILSSASKTFLPYELQPKQLLKAYKAQTVPLLPHFEHNKMVSDESQEAELLSLRASLQGERFFFVVNLHEMELEHVNGIGELLGYPDRNFNFYNYLDIVHPQHVYPHTMSSKAMLEGLNKGEIELKFIKHRYNSLIALKHNNGNYLLCKRTASVFQFNQKNQLTAYLNEFNIVGKFNEHPFSIMPASDKGENETLLEQLLRIAKSNFEKMKIFSERELQVLRIYAYVKGISMEQVAEKLNIKKSTVITFNKRIVESAEQKFSKEFNNAREVALYLTEAELM